MRTREKVAVLLVVASLLLGGVLYFTFRDNEVEANYSRWIFATNLRQLLASPAQFISDELPSGTVFYGGLTLFAAVMFIIFLKMTRDGEIQALRKRLMDLRSEKNQAESQLQEEVWKGKHERQSKDSVMRDLETSIEKIETLLGELNEKEQQLKVRDIELVSLKAGALDTAGTASGRPSAERVLREELHKRTEALQARDAAVKELEQRLSAKSRLWENQLREKDALLSSRAGELESLRIEIADLSGRVDELASSRKRAEDLLQEELRKKKEILEANDQAVRSEEKRLTERIRALENQAGEKDKIIRTRDTELNSLRRELGEVASAREETQARLQDDLAKAEQDRRAKDQLIKDLELRLSANLLAFQTEVGEKDLLLQARDGEMKALQAEVKAVSLRLSEMAAAKVRAEESLQEELKQEKQKLETVQAAHRELEERTDREMKHLAARQSEQEEILKRRDGEIQKARQEIDAAAVRLHETIAAKDQTEKALREQLRKEQAQREAKEAAAREAEQRYGGEIQELRNRLGEKEEFLKNRSEEINSLKTQVASLAEQLSKVGSAKERAATLLQQKLQAEKRGELAKDSALRQLEAGFNAKIEELQRELAAKEEAMGGRTTEVAALKSELASLRQKTDDLAAARQKAENLFEEAVKERAELAQAKDAALSALDAELNGRIREMETRLRDNDELLHRRESELNEVKNEIAELTAAKERAARSLGDDVRQKSALLEEKAAAIRALEERFSARIHTLESDLGEKQTLLDQRGEELKTLTARVHALSGDLTELGNSKDQALRLLQEDLKQRMEMLDSKESAMAALEERLNSKSRFLENQLSQKQELLAARDTELDALMAKVSELTQSLSEASAERERSDRLLQEELREKNALLESRETSIDDLEDQLRGRLESVERQVAEKHKLLETSGAEIAELREQLYAMTERFNEAEATKVALESSLQEERSKNTGKELMVVGADGDGQGLETLLGEREQLLQARDKLIQNLMTELKEKKTQLARQEIQVWQKIERREAWKHRLSKIGIRLRD